MATKNFHYFFIEMVCDLAAGIRHFDLTGLRGLPLAQHWVLSFSFECEFHFQFLIDF